MKLTQTAIVVTGVGVSSPIPIDTRVNPPYIFGSIVDGGASTYSIQYTTSDVFAPGYSPGSDPQWTGITGGPTTGSKPFNFNAAGATAIRLNVTVGPATVTLGPVFQSDNSMGS